MNGVEKQVDCMRLILGVIVCVVFALLISCKKYAPAPDAFFLRINSINVSTNPKQGSGAHKIVDLHLYVNGFFQGAYPVGSAMPIVTNNNQVKIEILPGIKNNGISDTRVFWRIYNEVRFDTLVESGKTIDRRLTFVYKESANFPWIEGFESNTVSGYSIEKSPESQVRPRIIQTDSSFEGKYLEIALTGDTIIGQIQSSGEGYVLPKTNENVYLELNYRCNQTFVVGMMTQTNQLKPIIYLKEQKDWNKIYIQLSTVLNTEPLSEKNKIYFRLLKEASDPTAWIHLDNIKLVYLQ